MWASCFRRTSVTEEATSRNVATPSGRAKQISTPSLSGEGLAADSAPEPVRLTSPRVDDARAATAARPVAAQARSNSGRQEDWKDKSRTQRDCYECYPRPWLPICCPDKEKEPIDYDPDNIPGDSRRRRLTKTAWDEGWHDMGSRRRQRRPRPISRPHQRGRPRRPSYRDTPWRSWK
ncbi:hypothetical protein ISCGN_022497 [Ixodes scapularis]